MKISTTLWTKPTSCRIIDAKGTVIGMIRVLGAAKSPLLSECVLHAHDCWEVILNLSGEGMETVDGEEAPFYAGSVTVCPPFAPHNKRCEAGAHWQDVYFRFEDGGFALGRRRFSDNSDHAMAQLMDMLQSACARRVPDGRFPAALGEAVCALLREWDEHDPPADALVEQLKSEISRRFTDPEFTPREAMAALGYCEDYLRRRFRRATGQTLTEYLTALRLNHARMLIEQNESASMPVREIALLSGFYDAAYFSRVFRRETGLSPRDYLQKRECDKRS